MDNLLGHVDMERAILHPPAPPQKKGLRWWQCLLMTVGVVSMINVRKKRGTSLRISDNPCVIRSTRSRKLSDDAKQLGMRYQTAWRWFRDGNIPGRSSGPHTIMITAGHEDPARGPRRIALSAGSPLSG